MKIFALTLGLFTLLGITSGCGIKGKPLPPLNEGSAIDQKSETTEQSQPEKKKNQ